MSKDGTILWVRWVIGRHCHDTLKLAVALFFSHSNFAAGAMFVYFLRYAAKFSFDSKKERFQFRDYLSVIEFERHCVEVYVLF